MSLTHPTDDSRTKKKLWWRIPTFDRADVHRGQCSHVLLDLICQSLSITLYSRSDIINLWLPFRLCSVPLPFTSWHVFSLVSCCLCTCLSIPVTKAGKRARNIFSDSSSCWHLSFDLRTTTQLTTQLHTTRGLSFSMGNPSNGVCIRVCMVSWLAY